MEANWTIHSSGSVGAFFFLKCQFMDGDVLLGIMNFQLVREWR